MSKPKDYYVSLEDAAFALGILDNDFLLWVKEDSPEIGRNYMNEKAILNSYLNECSKKENYLSKFKNSMQAENYEIENETTSKINFYQKERIDLLNLYTDFINDLIKLHQKFKEIVEKHGVESPVLAAYLLFSKAIATISCLVENLKNGYWYVGSMLREIDETLDVAHYFIISNPNETGNLDLQKWFRLGISPSHSKCRKAISKWYSELSPSVTQENHQELMGHLYGKKSKFTHPTFQSIRDCSLVSYQEDEVEIKNMCYGISSRQKRLWELTHFSKSSIWTCFQQFMVIFIDSMPLNQKDLDYLMSYNEKFTPLHDNLKW
jgi:hypothetical protein